jgi:hypothetical protein
MEESSRQRGSTRCERWPAFATASFTSYDETDDVEVVKALQHDLGDLDLFRHQIAEFLIRN